jgi:hypothetical protein
MPEIAIQLDPDRLSNPNLDIRYVLPDLIAEASKGLIKEDGYDYGRTSHRLTIYLHTKDLVAALPLVFEILEGPPVLGNHLAAEVTVVATSPVNHSDDERDYTAVYPPGVSHFSME